ncbi:TetR/AcrR family transcriptional regulator [Pseudoalteromonas piscicida]|uniref:TetR/AcrR family transcriptional regulator n=1 Tax=Pseudoalteromonas piscicida TaxID=43662 RepID=UPI0027E57AD4|nr:TetR/AcrR family transcriptional regulator [Pseudoalteromonas piscicida]WMO15977.1 TetR/AcrR family transcriptional regulator [Pseudoalteromonas piscicida]
MKTTKVAKPSRGRPAGDHDEKRYELLNIAIDLLANEGYAGLSMRNLANKAKVTTGAITYYFANKSELMKGISDELFRRFTLLLARNTDFDVERAIEEWVSWTYNDDGNLWKAFLQIQSYAAEDESFVNYAQKRYDVFISQLQLFIENGQKTQQIRNDIPADILAEQLSAMGDGLMIMRTIYPNRLSADKITQFKKGIITLLRPAMTV